MLALFDAAGVAHRTVVVPGGPCPAEAAITTGIAIPVGTASGTAAVTVAESPQPADVHTRNRATSVSPGVSTGRLQLVTSPVHATCGCGSGAPPLARWYTSNE